jgi:hypothetical protein
MSLALLIHLVFISGSTQTLVAIEGCEHQFDLAMIKAQYSDRRPGYIQVASGYDIFRVW